MKVFKIINTVMSPIQNSESNNNALILIWKKAYLTYYPVVVSYSMYVAF